MYASSAIESLISKKSNSESLDFAKKSLSISLKYFIDYLNKPSEENSSAMCFAANLSGKAISISKTTAPHAISYPFGKFSPSVILAAKEIGYKIQYSSIPGPFCNEIFDNVKRRSLVQFSNIDDLQAILRGGDNILASWYLKKHFIK